MVNGNAILIALHQAAALTRAKIHVHTSHNRFERDVFAQGTRLFLFYGLHQAPDESGVLIYLNKKTRQFAFIYGNRIDQAIGDSYWKTFSHHFSEDLHTTHPDNALSIAVLTLAQTLSRRFPSHSVKNK